MESEFYTGIATIDEEMALRKADEGFYRFLAQDIYAPISQSIHPDDLHRVKEAMEEIKSGRIPNNIVSARMKRKDGRYSWTSINMSFEPFEEGGKKLFSFRFLDLASAEDYNSAFQQLKNEYELILSMQDCIILSYDIKEKVLKVFRQCGTQRLPLFTGTLNEWQEELKDKIDPSSEKEFDSLCKKMEEGEKSIHHCIMTSAFAGDDTMESVDVKCQIIQHSSGKRKLLGRIIPCGATPKEDSDTQYAMDAGIPILNKKAITEYAQNVMAKGHGKVYLTVLDLDNFKAVNDTYGHMYGDEVLIKTAEIIKNNLGDYGMVGRIGGDEMMIVFTKVENQTELRNILRSIRMDVAWAYKGQDEKMQITCSMGAAAFPEHGHDYEEIFRLADRMLYIAKQKGKNRYVIYTPELHDAPKGEQDVSDNNFELLREDKAGVMQRLVEQFLVKKVVTYADELTKVGYCFELDEIVMVYGGMKVSTTWNRNGIFNDKETGVFLKPEEGFEESFDANGIYAVNGIFNLEGKLPGLAAALLERGIESALFYKICSKGRMTGFMMFAKKKHRQMWSEIDKALLAVVGKTMELSFSEK